MVKSSKIYFSYRQCVQLLCIVIVIHWHSTFDHNYDRIWMLTFNIRTYDMIVIHESNIKKGFHNHLCDEMCFYESTGGQKIIPFYRHGWDDYRKSLIYNFFNDRQKAKNIYLLYLLVILRCTINKKHFSE